ncbi:MAG TPA: glycoside hydrolase family 9 protein, partial [Polyangiaceae bacterium]|nr:glycoside hydrolase family 9 protein [Polyangiaceae bacterium]
EGANLVDGECQMDYGVRVDSVGYLTNRRKTAVFHSESSSFSIRRVDNDESVFDGEADGPNVARDTGEELYVADFTALKDAGTYYVQTTEGRSPEFSIGADALGSVLVATMQGLYGQRCGVGVELEHDADAFAHEACHLEEASLSRVGEGSRDDTGGWHDAGDYGKYVNNGAFAVAFLLKAFEHFPAFSRELALEIPEAGDDVPDLLDESRVELEWLLKVQYEDGSFAHKVTALHFEGMVMPEMDKQQRYFISASSASTADAVGALALAARLYEPYDKDFAQRCLESATKGQDWLDANLEALAPKQSDVETGGYTGGPDQDERIWALAEMWETTGNEAYLADLEERIAEWGASNEFDWPNAANLALSTYLRSERKGRNPAIRSRIAQSFLSVADGLAKAAHDDVYGRATPAYYWGSNGVVARFAFNWITAYYVEPKPEYLDGIQQQLDHLLGLNYYGRSFVTGVGEKPPRFPHHRPSEADRVDNPWPGLLIGGPHTRLFTEPEDSRAEYPAKTWTDTAPNYLHNEIAINWNTALAYALVAVAAANEDAKPCADCIVEDGAGGSGGGGGAGGAGQ